MKKFTNLLVLGVFAVSCLLAWAMLTLMMELRNAGRVLPFFTNLCTGLRPLLHTSQGSDIESGCSSINDQILASEFK